MCNGAEKVRVFGDEQARQLMFKPRGLTSKAPIVAIQESFRSPTLEETLSETSKIKVTQT